MTDVPMPALSDAMQEGTILTWLVDDGDPVAVGDELVEIETDKATMTYEAEAGGILRVLAPVGTTVAVGELIAQLGPADGSPDPVAAADPATDAPSPAGAPDPADGPRAPAEHASPQHVAATPVARRVAAIHGVALEALPGSGPRGRILRTDVLRAAGIREPERPSAPSGRRAAPPGPAPATAPAPEAGSRVELTRLQATIARRMAESKATVPHFQVQTEVDVTEALAFRAQLKAAALAQELVPPSINDLIVKASALALRRFPRANGSYTDDGFILHDRVNMGVAVAAPDALVVPVIHDADRLTLGEIAARARQLAAAVRDGTVTAQQLSGGTFTVSNLGMYGMTAITPVVNPPQAAILGVGAAREVLARDRAGELVDRRLLTLTLSCDHRILYGADAAQFLAAIRDALQAPLTLVL